MFGKISREQFEVLSIDFLADLKWQLAESSEWGGMLVILLCAERWLRFWSSTTSRLVWRHVVVDLLLKVSVLSNASIRFLPTYFS